MFILKCDCNSKSRKCVVFENNFYHMCIIASCNLTRQICDKTSILVVYNQAILTASTYKIGSTLFGYYVYYINCGDALNKKI